MLAEFRESLQKWKTASRFAEFVAKICKNTLKVAKPKKMIHYSIHVFNPLLSQRPLRQHDRLLVLGVVERERVEGLRGALRGIPEVLRQVEREVQDLRELGLAKLSKLAKILQDFANNFANFWRARSRLYQNEILQENMRLTTFFKCAHFCTAAIKKINSKKSVQKIDWKNRQFS